MEARLYLPTDNELHATSPLCGHRRGRDRLVGRGRARFVRRRVTLLDQDRPGRATSRWSFAWLNSNDKGPRPYHDLNHAGIRAWADLARDLDGDAWYRPVGHVELATSNAGRTELEARVHRLTRGATPPVSST